MREGFEPSDLLIRDLIPVRGYLGYESRNGLRGRHFPEGILRESSIPDEVRDGTFYLSMWNACVGVAAFTGLALTTAACLS